MSYSEQLDLFATVYTYIAGGKATPDRKECPPLGIEYGGIWYQSDNSNERKFYTHHDFNDLLTQAILAADLDIEDIIKLYRMVMGVNAYADENSEKNDGIWIETEMETFQCTQCGHCCLELNDAYGTTAREEDLERWEREDRQDILDYVVLGDLWVSPRTGEDVFRCPWLRKLPKKDKYICRIHDTKPKHCRDYPKSKKHALKTGCQGFNKNTAG